MLDEMYCCSFTVRVPFAGVTLTVNETFEDAFLDSFAGTPEIVVDGSEDASPAVRTAAPCMTASVPGSPSVRTAASCVLAAAATVLSVADALVAPMRIMTRQKAMIYMILLEWFFIISSFFSLRPSI